MKSPLSSRAPAAAPPSDKPRVEHAAPAPAAAPSLGHRFDQVPVHAGGLPFRAELESRFGENFSTVEVAVGSEELARSGVRAAASTEKIAFADARPDRATVAHELAHVVQHRHAAGAAPARAESRRSDAAEREADTLGERAAAGAEVAPREAPVAAWHFARFKEGDSVRANGKLGIVFEVLHDGGSDEAASRYIVTVDGERSEYTGAQLAAVAARAQPEAPSASNTASIPPPSQSAPPRPPTPPSGPTATAPVEEPKAPPAKSDTKEVVDPKKSAAPPPMNRLVSRPMEPETAGALSDEWLKHDLFKTKPVLKPNQREDEHPVFVARDVIGSIKDEVENTIPNMAAIKAQPWAKKNPTYANLDPGTVSAAHDSKETPQGLMIHRVMNARYITIVWLTSSPEYLSGAKKGVGATLMGPVIAEADAKDLGMKVSPQGPDAADVYVRYGFVQSPLVPKEYWRPSPTVKKAMAAASSPAKARAMLSLEIQFGDDSKMTAEIFKTKLAELATAD